MKHEIETDSDRTFRDFSEMHCDKVVELRIRPNLKRILIVSGAVFVVSLIAFGVLSLFVYDTLRDPISTDIPNLGSGPGSTVLIYAVITSIVTTFGSAVTFVSTFVLAWRKEGREKQKEDREQEAFFLDNERKKLENERLALEIEEIKKKEKKKTKIAD